GDGQGDSRLQAVPERPGRAGDPSGTARAGTASADAPGTGGAPKSRGAADQQRRLIHFAGVKSNRPHRLSRRGRFDFASGGPTGLGLPDQPLTRRTPTSESDYIASAARLRTSGR